MNAAKHYQYPFYFLSDSIGYNVVLSSYTEFDAVFAGSVRKFKVRSILLILVIPPMLSVELLPWILCEQSRPFHITMVFRTTFYGVLIMLPSIAFDVLLFITVNSTMDTIDIRIAVINIRLYDCDAGNEPTIPSMVVWYICINIPAITGPTDVPIK